MVSDIPRWMALLVLALALVGLIAFARGTTHQRGDDVGSQPPPSFAVTGLLDG